MASHVMVLLLLCITAVHLAAGKYCPDNVSTCADGNTCCPMKDEVHYGCCPQSNAVCCSDHVHCCPAGMTCDVKHTRCSLKHRGGGSIMWILALLGRTDTPMMPLRQNAVNTVGETRVEQPRIVWSEHPVQAALQSTRGNQTFQDMLPCPDSSVCPGQYTCCPFSNGSYGCCPYSQGVCCPDHLSCCPHATTCGAGSTCQPN